MISIQSSLNELDRAHQIREGLLDCYLSAIKNCANYAIELDEDATAKHRKYLRTLGEEVACGENSIVLESRAILRNLLRDFRDKGSQYLATLRDELANTARTLEEVLESLSQSDGDHESRLRKTIQNLREIADGAEGQALAPVLRNAASTIEQSVEQMRKQHQVTVSQFQIEIRMLHKRIDSLEAAASVDELTRFLNRAEMESSIRNATPGEYCLLLVSARGLRRAEVQFGPPVAEELEGAFAKRLRNSVPPQSVIARWGREEMVALLPTKKSEAVASGKWITEHLSGPYPCLCSGKTVRPVLQLNVGVVDTVTSESPDAVLTRIGIFLTGS
jgi:GGDEF domain-containing protein